jgi:tetratricopeptide (TPR) repeat protein
LAALRAKRGLMNFAAPTAAHAYRSALEAIEVAHAFRPSHGGKFAQSFCRIGLGEGNKVPPLPKLSPTSATDYYFMGMLHYWFGSFPSDPVSQFALGPVRRLGGLDFEKPLDTAEWMLRTSARLEPRHYWNHFWLAWCLMAKGDFKGSELAYNTCVAIRPEDGLGYSERASMLVSQLDDDNPEQLQSELRGRAVQDLEQAHRLAPNDARVQFSRALVFVKLGDADRAMAAAAIAIELDGPLSRWAGKRAYGAKRQVLNGIKGYSANVTDQDPMRADAWALQAISEYSLGNFEAAIEHADQCIQLQSDHARARAVRGSIRLLKGDIDAAQLDFQIAVQASPSNFLARIGMAQAYEIAGRTEEASSALDFADAVAVKDWQRALAFMTRAKVLQRQSKHAQAAELMDRARRSDPKVTGPSTPTSPPAGENP